MVCHGNKYREALYVYRCSTVSVNDLLVAKKLKPPHTNQCSNK